jgi:RNA polymerase sigma factor (sigma-70 family)
MRTVESIKRGRGQKKNSETCSFYGQIQKYPPLSDKEYEALGKRILKNKKDQGAIDLLVLHNMRFMFGIAHQYTFALERKKEYALNIEDLKQVGVFGLTTAAKKWKYKKGKFTTYAKWWIRHEICSAILNNGLIRIPSNVEKLSHKVLRMMEEIAEREGRPPIDSDIEKMAKTLRVAPSRVRTILRTIQMSVISINEKRPGCGDDDPGEEGEWENIIPSDRFLQPDQVLEGKQELYTACQQLDALIQTIRATEGISEREQDIFIRYYGLDGPLEKRTLKEVAKPYRITRERARQLIEKVRKKIKKIHRSVNKKDIMENQRRVLDLESLLDTRMSVNA